MSNSKPTKKRTSTRQSSTSNPAPKRQAATITPQDVITAGGVTDELIEPFIDSDNDYEREQFRSSVASYCRYLDSVDVDQRAAALNVPIVTA